MSAYKFAGQLPVPTYDAEVSCGPFCSGGRVSFTATTSPDFTELYDVWVKAEDVATLATERDQLAVETARLREALEAARAYIGMCAPHSGDTSGRLWGRVMDMTAAALAPAPTKKENERG